MNTVQDGKPTAIVAYLTIIGTVIAIVMNNEKKNVFAAFHIRQALGLFLTHFALGYFVSAFDNWVATRIFWGILAVLWLIGFIGAIRGQQEKIPVLGNLYQRLFKSIP